MQPSSVPDDPTARRAGPSALRRGAGLPEGILGWTLLAAPGPARAAELPLDQGPQAGLHGLDPGPPLAAWLDLAGNLDERPAFRLARQDRLSAGLEVQGTAHPALSMWTSTRLAQTRSEAARIRRGLEGLLLGARLRPTRLLGTEGWARPSVVVEGRLPLGAAIDGVASRAADALVGAELSLAPTTTWAWRLRASAALEVLGDPARPAEQDDRLRATLGVATAPGPFTLSLQGEWIPASPRNLGAARLVGRIQAAPRVPLGLELSAGSGGAARLGLRIWGGVTGACRPPTGDYPPPVAEPG